mgnify:CR=1 FL=1
MNAEHHEGTDPIGDFLRAHLDAVLDAIVREVRKGGKDEMRVCQVSNRLALTWHPAAVSVKVV